MVKHKTKLNKKNAIIFGVVIVMITALFSFPVAADPITYTAGMGFAAMAEAYGMQAGAAYAFDQFSNNDRTQLFIDNFDSWQASKHAADSSYVPQLISDWESAHESDVAFEEQYGRNYVGPIDMPYNATLMKFNSIVADELNQFYNWFLNTLGLTHSHSSGGFSPSVGTFDSPILIENISPFTVLPVTNFDYNSIVAGGFVYAISPWHTTDYASAGSSGVVCFFSYYNGNPCLFFVSSQPTSVGYLSGVGNNSPRSVSLTTAYDSYYYGRSAIYDGGTFYVDRFSDYIDGLAAAGEFLSGGAVSSSVVLVPYAPTLTDGVISIPDTTSQDYVPTAVETVIGIPWVDGYADTGALELVAPVVAEQTLQGELELVEPLEAPPVVPEVSIPLLPVNLPNFNFNFSGIWHYVRDWIASLGSWFSLMFTVWAGLPYAMVVPVYASAVIVIVVGMYRRFFM